jgi:hypothetical protein
LLLTLVLFYPAFAQTERKVTYGILVDNSGSLRTQFPEVLRISKGIVEQAYQRGSISSFNFETQGDERNSLAVITPGTAWSQDKNLIEKYINSLFIVPGRTTLMDAINSIAERLNSKASLDKDAVGEKVIFLITDGEDRVSKIKEKQLIKILKESGIKVYVVGLIEELDDEDSMIHESKREKAVDFLEKITKETGGRAVFPKSKKNDVSRLLNELFTQ